MAQSLSNVLLHIVFSTKNRQNWIQPDIESELYRYLAATCRSFDCPAIQIGGTENHVHILCRMARTITISKLVEKVKTGSSKWMIFSIVYSTGIAWMFAFLVYHAGRLMGFS